jgi:hypothetical protein
MGMQARVLGGGHLVRSTKKERKKRERERKSSR